MSDRIRVLVWGENLRVAERKRWGVYARCAPGASDQEPGGFTPRQVIDTLRALEPRGHRGDIVEFNSRRDVSHLTENVSAKLAKEIAARMLVRANS